MIEEIRVQKGGGFTKPNKLTPRYNAHPKSQDKLPLRGGTKTFPSTNQTRF